MRWCRNDNSPVAREFLNGQAVLFKVFVQHGLVISRVLFASGSLVRRVKVPGVPAHDHVLLGLVVATVRKH